MTFRGSLGRSFSAPPNLLPDTRFGDEAALVRRSRADDNIRGLGSESPSDQLLEAILCLTRTGLRGSHLDLRPQEALDSFSGRLDAPVEIHGSQHGFERIGQDRLPVSPAGSRFSPAQQQC